MKKSKVILIVCWKGSIFSSSKAKGYVFESSLFWFNIGDNFTCELNICSKWDV